MTICRKIEIITLIITTLFGIYFSLDFGYLLTNYGHGGQLLGIPFAAILFIYSALIIFLKDRLRLIFRIIHWTYLASMILYVLTVLTIKKIKQDEAFAYLHHFSPPHTSLNERLFIGFSISGIVICVFILFTLKRKRITN